MDKARAVVKTPYLALKGGTTCHPVGSGADTGAVKCNNRINMTHPEFKEWVREKKQTFGGMFCVTSTNIPGGLFILENKHFSVAAQAPARARLFSDAYFAFCQPLLKQLDCLLDRRLV